MKLNYISVAAFLLLSPLSIAESSASNSFSSVSSLPHINTRNNVTQVLSKVIEIIEEIKGLDYNVYSTSTLKEDLAFDSLNYSTFVYECENEFDVSFSSHQIGIIRGDHTTVNDVAVLINSILPVPDPDPEDDE